MDSAIGAAARALSLWDPLLALKYVALRSDPPALALRGIAMAQLGELAAAHALLRRAEKAFGEGNPVARARCVLARAEVALARRDLNGAARGLDAAGQLLTARGDVENAVFAQLLEVRRLTLKGDVAAAHAALESLSSEAVSFEAVSAQAASPEASPAPTSSGSSRAAQQPTVQSSLAGAPARLVAVAALAKADLAMRQTDCASAELHLAAARAAALASKVAPLMAEVERLAARLAAPVARLLRGGIESHVYLRELAAFTQPAEVVVDACRREVRCGAASVNLVRRPVLLELCVALSERAPSEVTREVLITRAFGARRVTESHRARLRVEIGRLRKLLHPLTSLQATAKGYSLTPHDTRNVLVLLPPGDGASSALLALLQGGESWATSALAEAVGKSQRAVQRALSELEQDGKVQAMGKGRAQRWVAAPATTSATALFLVAPGTL